MCRQCKPGWPTPPMNPSTFSDMASVTGINEPISVTSVRRRDWTGFHCSDSWLDALLHAPFSSAMSENMTVCCMPRSRPVLVLLVVRSVRLSINRTGPDWTASNVCLSVRPSGLDRTRSSCLCLCSTFLVYFRSHLVQVWQMSTRPSAHLGWTGLRWQQCPDSGGWTGLRWRLSTSSSFYADGWTDA